MSTPNFQPLLFGGDINVYSVARAFHEAYGVKSIAYGKYISFPCAYSSIIDYRPCVENEDEAVFLRNVETVAAEHADKTVLVVGCGDSYVKLAAHLRDKFPPNVTCNYITGEMMDMLTDKEQFYALCDRYGIDHPNTFVYDGSMGHDFALPWGAPYIAKPADGVAYWATGHSELAKVYLCQTWEELLAALDQVYAAGYPGKMILQEFVPGDDTYMRVLTNYSDTKGKVKLMCLGHVLLEEHSPHGIGNHAVIITEHDGDLCARIRGMLEDIGYVGFSNFDIKFDTRDGKYKAFEINTRQGRSNYYVTGSGHNIATYLVGDLLEGKDLPLTEVKDRTVWRMIPRRLALTFIPKSYHRQMKELFRKGTDHHSMEYRADYTAKRIWRIWKNHIGTYVRFYRHNQKARELRRVFMSEQKLGVLGGMGPQATQMFYQFVLDRTDAARDQDHLPALILSDTGMPDRTAAILSGDTAALYARLLADAKLLEGCGCTAIAIPCNTSHYFVDRLQGEVGVPILHMIRETARAVAALGKSRPAILATDGTIQSGLYQSECAALGLDAVAPDEATQQLVMSIIYDEIKQGEQGSREKFAQIDRAIRKAGCDCAILACTELSVFSTYHPLPPFYVDAMAVLAERAVLSCGYPLRTI